MSANKQKHVHLMGICGTAMASLAGLLQVKGYKVTGSDQNFYPPMSTQLEKLKIPVSVGYKAENLSPRPDLVIVGNVISKTNPEADALLKSDIPYTSLPKAMGDWIIENRKSLVVTGTHGKTTTTSLLSWIADVAGCNPGFLIGGIPSNFSLSFRATESEYFIIEGDEYDTAFFDKVPKFIHYKPSHVITTSIEFDHADIYADLEAVKKSFMRLIQMIPKNGLWLYWKGDKNIESIKHLCTSLTAHSYGFEKDADYSIQKLGGSDFEVSFKGQSLGKFTTTMSGDYNLLNTTSCIAMAHHLGWDMDLVRKALKSFLGVKRRQEIRGEPNKILVIEDFAHHPTAVRETLKGLQERYQGRKIFAVFEPRSATSRRKVFQKDYVEAFSQAQSVLLMQAFDQTKISEADRFSSVELASDLRGRNIEAAEFANVQDIVNVLKEKAKPTDVIVIMSNGGFDGIYDKLLAALS